MPHETIHPRHHGTSQDPAPYARVTWVRDRYVQVAVIRDAPAEPSLDAAEARVGDPPAAVEYDPRPHSQACGITCGGHGTACSNDCPTCGGRADAATWVHDPEPAKPSLKLQLDALGLPAEALAILDRFPTKGDGPLLRDAVSELLVAVHAHTMSQGIWCDLDRDGCNVMIRALRRARDQAYGKDA